MKVLFLFLDGVGLGAGDPSINPFTSARTPTLDHLLAGKKLIAATAPHRSSVCTLLGIDAQLGIKGLPQSATGQATLLTGINFAERLGFHFVPKPNSEIYSYFSGDETPKTIQDLKNPEDHPKDISIFSHLLKTHHKVCLLNAYPDSYFAGIDSRKHNHSVIPLAVTSAGIPLFTQEDLFLGNAVSADFTGQGWHDHLLLPQTPILTSLQAGEKLASLTTNYDFSLFEFWESDYIGHKQDFTNAIRLIEKLDVVLAGLLNKWDFENGVILITSDHGNLEDLSTRKHTNNKVPALILGKLGYQQLFSQKVKSIADITPFIMEIFN